MAARLGRTPRHVQGPFAQLLPLLERGDVDLLINGIDVDEDRRRAYGLTRPYWAGPLRLTVRRGDAHAPSTLEELRGRPVGTIPGTLSERRLRSVGADVRTYDGGQEDPYRDLLLGRTDAVLLESPVALYYGDLPGLVTLEANVGETRYAAVTRRSDEALRAAVDAALASLIADGTLPRILARWGLWNTESAQLFGVAEVRGVLPVELERWRKRNAAPPWWRSDEAPR